MSASEAILRAVVWYAAASALATLVYPMVFYATPGLPDRGLSIARPIGLLLAVLGPWWLAASHVVTFSNVTIVAVPAIIGLGCWIVALRHRELLSFVRRQWRTLAVLELLSLALFLGYVLFRGFNPDVAFTEKPMDMAFLNSAIHTHSMPPPDPWFSGQPINYYYLGYVMMAVIARLTQTAAGVAFNLSLAILFAMGTTAAAGTAANIVRSRPARVDRSPRRWPAVVAGALGAVFLVGIGNLVTAVDFLKHPAQTIDAGWWQGVGWNASRVIVDHGVPGTSGPRPTINEFPAFTFVLGDLHPHVLAFPLFISAIGLAFSIMYSYSRRGSDGERPGAPISLVVSGMVVGALYAINSWDMPTALLLVGGAILVATCKCNWRRAVVPIAGLVGVAGATALPFAVGYTPAIGADTSWIPSSINSLPIISTIVRTIGVVIWPRSALGPLLEIYGLFLVLILVLIAAVWRRTPPELRPPWKLLAVGAPLVLVVSVAAQFGALFLFATPLAVLGWLLKHSRLELGLRFAAWLAALGMLLVLIPELFFLQDAFGDRMNTVFKVYFQVWSIMAVTGAAGLILAWPIVTKGLGRIRAIPVAAVIGILLAGSLLYPSLSAYRWSNDFTHWQGLDGLAYIGQADAAELAGIDWLRAHGQPGDVVLEAPGCSYGVVGMLPHDRVSMATGIPTVIGWNFHEYQWRNGIPSQLAEIQTREQDVNQIYEDPTSSQAHALLDRYGVTYIYVGTLERRGYGPSCTLGPPYPSDSLARFAELGWMRAFQQGDVTIYRRPTADLAGFTGPN